MDSAYSQYSSRTRRKAQSSFTLNHLSLAPLTSKLPIEDIDELPEPMRYRRPSHARAISYLEGKSAPATPGILSRSTSRVSLRKPVSDGLTKSQSSSNVASTQISRSKSQLSITRRRNLGRDDSALSSLTMAHRNDSDWLLRAGALISSETRESKGQSWLVSRASSTSLTGQLDEDEEALERQLARERESQLNSRRGSAADADDEFSPITTRMSCGGRSRSVSRYGSQANSMVQSRKGSKADLSSSEEKERELRAHRDDEFGAEPDFVDANEEIHESIQEEDETTVRKLVAKGSLGLGLWFEELMGWPLFASDEDGDAIDMDTNGEKTETDASDTAPLKAHSIQVISDCAEDATHEKLPLPRPDEGGWQDAAWLLSIASKVLF